MQFKQQGLKSYRSKKEFLKEIIFTKLHDSWMNTEHYKNSQFLKNHYFPVSWVSKSPINYQNICFWPCLRLMPI